MHAAGTEHPTLRDETVVLSPAQLDRGSIGFTISAAGEPVGTVALHDRGDGLAELSWTVPAEHDAELVSRAVHLVMAYAFSDLGVERLEAYVDATDAQALRVAGRSGLLREGVLRRRGTDGAGRHDRVLLARLPDDPHPRSRDGFIGMLNAGLPRKRAIAQALIRDPGGRVLLCETTYKQDWDLPGGVVEPGESPRAGLGRELLEELGTPIEVGALLAVDWLPSWRGWDDATAFVFDAGVRPVDFVDTLVLQPREIRAVHWGDATVLAEHCAGPARRRLTSLLEHSSETAVYLEAGRLVEG